MCANEEGYTGACFRSSFGASDVASDAEISGERDASPGGLD